MLVRLAEFLKILGEWESGRMRRRGRARQESGTAGGGARKSVIVVICALLLYRKNQLSSSSICNVSAHSFSHSSTITLLEAPPITSSASSKQDQRRP